MATTTQQKKSATRHGFKTGEYIVYPAHGVGQGGDGEGLGQDLHPAVRVILPVDWYLPDPVTGFERYDQHLRVEERLHLGVHRKRLVPPLDLAVDALPFPVHLLEIAHGIFWSWPRNRLRTFPLVTFWSEPGHLVPDLGQRLLDFVQGSLQLLADLPDVGDLRLEAAGDVTGCIAQFTGPVAQFACDLGETARAEQDQSE